MLCAVSCFGLGVATVMVVAPAPAPAWADPTGDPRGVVRLIAQEHSGQVPVSAELVVSAEVNVAWPTGGVLRRTECAEGGLIDSGSIPFVVDDRPILALHTDVPLWRDLARGSVGDDVLALQRELNRLGASIPEDGRYRATTAGAVRDLWERLGGDPRLRTVPLAQVIWLPEAAATGLQCTARIGERVEQGQDALVIGQRLESLHLALPADPRDGQWVATIPGTEHATAVPPDGIVRDAEFLAAIEQTEAFAQVVDGDRMTLSVQVRLAEPVSVVAVPASALYDVDGSVGCVIAHGEPTLVRILDSQFGKTHVTADPLPRQVEVSPAASQSCR